MVIGATGKIGVPVVLLVAHQVKKADYVSVIHRLIPMMDYHVKELMKTLENVKNLKFVQVEEAIINNLILFYTLSSDGKLLL